MTRSDDRIASYSSRGPTWHDGFAKPDVAAPGHRIAADAALHGTLYDAYPALRVKARDSWSYFRLSGTSMAAAVTTGVVAHMLEANRNTNNCKSWPLEERQRNREGCTIRPNAVKAALQHTALSMTGATSSDTDILTHGAGGLNGGGAIDLAKAMNTRTGIGEYWLHSPPAGATIIGEETWAWGQALVWGNVRLQGNAIEYNQHAWGNALVWGNDTTWGKALVWGNNDVVWDDPATWGQALVWGNTSLLTYADGSALVWGNLNAASAGDLRWWPLPQPAYAALALANPEMQ